jgi:hypothetical protein
MARVAPPLSSIGGHGTDVSARVEALEREVNGNLDQSNLSASAGLRESQMATAASGLTRATFRAHRAAALSLTSGSAVVFDTKPVDRGAYFDSTNGRFTPAIAGDYRFSWAVWSSAILAADMWWVASLRRNAAVVAVGHVGYQRGAALAVNTTGSDVQSANGTTDFFDVIIEHGVGAGAAAGIAVGAADTYFAGELIGRA